MTRDPVLRVVPRPEDINSNGHIFGGWILSQMDIAAGIVARRRAKNAVATVALDGMKFIQPILLGDIISVYGEIKRVGRTSLAIHVEVTAQRHNALDELKVTEGIFTFVALGPDLQPTPVDS